MKRGGTRKREKIKKAKGKVSDAEKELARINILLKARAQKNDEFYIDQKEKEIFRQAQLEKEEFGNTRPAELLKKKEYEALQKIMKNPNNLSGRELDKLMRDIRTAKTKAIKANPLTERPDQVKHRKPAKKPAKTAKKEKKPKK
tara:strand:- start:92 stop:523 length:432 start_codon:yes stop_codon:yes gene_type:complete